MVNKLTWQMVAFMGVLAATTVGLASFTDLDSGAILGVLGVLAGIGGGAAVGGAMTSKVDEVHAETQAQTSTLDEQTSTLDTIAQRVNGELDARISEAMEDAAETGAARVLKVLREQGVIH